MKVHRKSIHKKFKSIINTQLKIKKLHNYYANLIIKIIQNNREKEDVN